MATLPSKKFQRCQENFVCNQCGAAVQGNGYTNHCPKCLWSKHVDSNPGDRKAACQGMMEPCGLELKTGNYYLLHRCIKCGLKRKNKLAPADDLKTALRIVKNKN